MTKYRIYRLRLDGDAELVSLLKEHLNQPKTLSQARTMKKSLKALFGDRIEVEIISSGREPLTVRRL